MSIIPSNTFLVIVKLGQIPLGYWRHSRVMLSIIERGQKYLSVGKSPPNPTPCAMLSFWEHIMKMPTVTLDEMVLLQVLSNQAAIPPSLADFSQNSAP